MGSRIPPPTTHTEVEEDNHSDTDAILAELEAEDNLSLTQFQQSRIQEIRSTSTPASKSLATASSQPVYITLTSDEQTLQFTTEHAKAIVHFFHPDFPRCVTMDIHLTSIAQTHEDFSRTDSDVQFARVDVQKAEFVVQKLGIRVLPCVIGFVKGVVKGRVVGFEGICWDGKEKERKVGRALEEVMVEWGCLGRRLMATRDGDGDDDDGSDEEDEDRRRGAGRRGIQGSKQRVLDEDDDWD